MVKNNDDALKREWEKTKDFDVLGGKGNKRLDELLNYTPQNSLINALTGNNMRMLIKPEQAVLPLADSEYSYHSIIGKVTINTLDNSGMLDETRAFLSIVGALFLIDNEQYRGNEIARVVYKDIQQIRKLKDIRTTKAYGERCYNYLRFKITIGDLKFDDVDFDIFSGGIKLKEGMIIYISPQYAKVLRAAGFIKYHERLYEQHSIPYYFNLGKYMYDQFVFFNKKSILAVHSLLKKTTIPTIEDVQGSKQNYNSRIFDKLECILDIYSFMCSWNYVENNR